MIITVGKATNASKNAENFYNSDFATKITYPVLKLEAF